MLEIRKARVDEIDEVIKLSNYVFRETVGHAATMGQQFPTMLNKENADSIYAALSDGKIVSIACTVLNDVIIYGHRISMASLGSVCTHPDYQGRGIGSRLLDYVYDDLKAKKAGIVTISGNRGIYKRNKAVNQGNVYYYESESAELSETNKSNISFEYLTDSNSVSRLSRIYLKEPVRYSRGVKEFPILFNARPMVIPNETNKLSAFVARVGNEDLAYIIGFKMETAYRIVEYAGERSIILTLIKETEKFGFSSFSLDVLEYDEALLRFMDVHSIKPKHEGEMHTTVRITNRAELLRQLTPIFMEVYAYSSEGIEELIYLLPEDDDECAKVLFDGRYKRELLDMAIPLPWPNGLNFI